jgi:hypothetical protein
VATHAVIIQARLEPSIDASAAAAAVMEQLLELGATDAALKRDGHTIEIHIPVEARTQADALAKGSQLVARSLDGEPVHHVTARVGDEPR